MTITTYDNPLLTGVIGNPILHSKSPKLHNYWLNKYSISGYYIPIAVNSNKLKSICNVKKYCQDEFKWYNKDWNSGVD